MSNVLVYITSGALVYFLLMGIHYAFTPAGLNFKLYALAYLLGATIMLLLLIVLAT